MHVQLKTTLDCTPDEAWRALRSPTVLRELYGPFIEPRSMEPGGYPTVWEPGDHTVEMRAGGAVALGHQQISLAFDDHRADGVRILVDSGRALSGPLALLTGWKHRMAVSVAPGDPSKTLYRDRLEFGGPLAPVMWPVLWQLWQWREVRLRSMAASWAFDPENVG